MFQSRREVKKKSSFADVAAAALTIQRSWRRYKKKRDAERPDLNDKEVQKAAVTIQSHYKGYQTRKKDLFSQTVASSEDSSETESEQEEDLPDLDDKDVQEAAIKIQSAFKGFKVRSQKKVAVSKKRVKKGYF